MYMVIQIMQFANKDNLVPHKKIHIHDFVDIDQGGNLVHKRYGSDFFNLLGGAINWMSKKQTTKVEYMATTHGIKESTWLIRLCSCISLIQNLVMIGCNISSAIFQ